MILSADMIPNYRIPLYTVKLNIVLDVTLVKAYCIYKHVVGFFQEHLSENTTTIHMTVTNCVTYNQ